MRLPCLDCDRRRWQRPKHRVLVAARVPGPAEAFDDLQRIDRNSEKRKGAKRGEAGANAEHQGQSGRGFRERSDVNPGLRWMKTCFGKKARRARSDRAGGEFSRNMRKKKQTANDTNNVQAVRQIKVLRLDAEVIPGEPHVQPLLLLSPICLRGNSWVCGRSTLLCTQSHSCFAT